jgi:hypothetical protein
MGLFAGSSNGIRPMVPGSAKQHDVPGAIGQQGQAGKGYFHGKSACVAANLID